LWNEAKQYAWFEYLHSCKSLRPAERPEIYSAGVSNKKSGVRRNRNILLSALFFVKRFNNLKARSVYRSQTLYRFRGGISCHSEVGPTELVEGRPKNLLFCSPSQAK